MIGNGSVHRIAAFMKRAAHAPHQAPADWIARFRGKFDGGWDRERELILARQKQLGVVPADTVLSPRPEVIPAWDSLTADERKVYARYMEVYAAMVDILDQNVGRLIDHLKESGQWENTLTIFVSDNGACPFGRGGATPNTEPYDPNTHWGDSTGWAWARAWSRRA